MFQVVLASGGEGFVSPFLIVPSQLHFNVFRPWRSHVCRAVLPMQFLLLSRPWFCLFPAEIFTGLITLFLDPASCRKGHWCLFSWASVVRLVGCHVTQKSQSYIMIGMNIVTGQWDTMMDTVENCDQYKELWSHNGALWSEQECDRILEQFDRT